jgi:hypothetical protein
MKAARRSDRVVQRLLGQYPSLGPEIARLQARRLRVASPAVPPAEQLELVPRDPAEARPTRRRRHSP